MAADLPTAWGVRDSRVDSAAAEREIKPCVSRVWEAHQWSKWSFGGMAVVFCAVSTQLVLWSLHGLWRRKPAKREIPARLWPPPPNSHSWVHVLGFPCVLQLCLSSTQTISVVRLKWQKLQQNAHLCEMRVGYLQMTSPWSFFSLPPTSPWHVTAGHCHLSHARAPLKRVLSLARYCGARTIVRKAAASVQARRRIHKLCRAVTLSQGNNTDFVFKVFAGCCWFFFFCSGSGGIKVSNPRG